MKRLRLLTVLMVFLSYITWNVKKDDSLTTFESNGMVVDSNWMKVNDDPLTPENYRRPPDQTFLTYPEWFLVHSPAEMAEAFGKETATVFPFNDHVSQFWDSYRAINQQIEGTFPHNAEYHTMIKVIGVSATAEYWLRQAYEVVVGRVTDTENPYTAEDRFNQEYIQDYVSFIHEKPWYLFDFNEQLKNLWAQTPIWGAHWLRKLERRYLLTSELMVKSAYGYLIGVGTKELYGTAESTTAVVVNHLNMKELSDFNIIESFSDTQHLIELPRYRPFKQAAISIAQKGGQFEEIAGNQSAILLTVLADKDWKAESVSKVIFTQPLPSGHGTVRKALVTPVDQLHQLLNELSESKVEIEHVYDF